MPKVVCETMKMSGLLSFLWTKAFSEGNVELNSFLVLEVGLCFKHPKEELLCCS